MNQTLVPCGHRKVCVCTAAMKVASVNQPFLTWSSSSTNSEHAVMIYKTHSELHLHFIFTFYIYCTTIHANIYTLAGCHARCWPGHQEQFWGSVSSSRTLQHADQGNQTNDLPITRQPPLLQCQMIYPRLWCSGEQHAMPTNRHLQIKRWWIQWNTTAMLNSNIVQNCEKIICSKSVTDVTIS